jgi:hypothetical protein
MVTRWVDAIENTQALAKMCRIEGLLENAWGSHGASMEGIVNSGMPRDYRSTKENPARRYARTHLSELFAGAEPYFVDAGLQAVIEASAKSVPGGTRLHPRLFRSSKGCLFFERPVSGMAPRLLHTMTNRPDLPSREPAPLSGFAWQVSSDAVVIVLLYSWAADDTNPNYMQGVYIGNIPLTVAPWEFATMTLDGWTRFHNDKIVDTERDNADRFEMSAKIVVATLLLMDQVLTYIGSHPVDRGTRKRVLKAGWQFEPSVQVVRLRRVEYVRPNAEAGHVDWACRWMVRQHWRTYARGTSEERTVLIHTYLKGPEGKPLKVPSARVFDVSR